MAKYNIKTLKTEYDINTPPVWLGNSEFTIEGTGKGRTVSIDRMLAYEREGAKLVIATCDIPYMFVVTTGMLVDNTAYFRVQGFTLPLEPMSECDIPLFYYVYILPDAPMTFFVSESNITEVDRLLNELDLGIDHTDFNAVPYYIDADLSFYDIVVKRKPTAKPSRSNRSVVQSLAERINDVMQQLKNKS